MFHSIFCVAGTNIVIYIYSILYSHVHICQGYYSFKKIMKIPWDWLIAMSDWSSWKDAY